MKNIGENKKLLMAAGVFIVAIIATVLIVIGVSNSGSKKRTTDYTDKQQENINKDAPITENTDNEDLTGSAVTQDDKENPSVEETQSEPENVTEQALQIPESVPTPAPATYSESEGSRKVYLTFDDGTSEQTDKVLDILAQYGVKATFFVTAQGGEENAARYRRIVAEGHSIGLHSVTHRYKEIYASLDAFIADVEGIRQFVLNTTGVNSYLYRFPGGSSNSVSNVPMEDCIRYLNQNGYRYFDWNIDTADSVNRQQPVDELVSRVLGENIDKYHNTVILMHDSGSQDITVAALPRIIEGLKARGLEILPITENTPVVQHKKAASVQ